MIQGVLAHCLHGCLPWPHCAIPSPPCPPPLLTPDWEIAGESEVLWVMEEGTASGSQTHHPSEPQTLMGRGRKNTPGRLGTPLPSCHDALTPSLGPHPNSRLQPGLGRSCLTLLWLPQSLPLSLSSGMRVKGHICEAPSSRATL